VVIQLNKTPIWAFAWRPKKYVFTDSRHNRAFNIPCGDGNDEISVRVTLYLSLKSIQVTSVRMITAPDSLKIKILIETGVEG
jgi:hypothetical protein